MYNTMVSGVGRGGVKGVLPPPRVCRGGVLPPPRVCRGGVIPPPRPNFLPQLGVKKSRRAARATKDICFYLPLALPSKHFTPL